ncbi:DMT family transporter [Methylobacterium nonmethylotrophicum]|uniref:DMT family transporter n=1 Tax=Methylobacterium nonmethylotrophicum TaxID=1141884 RepID=A0A4Z0NFL1_9HYPH|nr:DMT family transporter [Methylobacterium nonmethylotrophicum]TGD95027.1 DMT family transporter [Methylobacterium nonmethylotrophicum]
MQPANRPMTPSEWGLLLGLSVLWGGSFFFVGVALRALPPLTLVVLRVGLAAAILALVLRARGLPLPRGAIVWRAFFGAALLNNAVPFCLIAWGQTQIASGLAAILNATTPLFGVLVAHALTDDERLTPGRLAGVLAGLSGVAVMVGPSVLAGLGAEALAQGAVLLAALSYAFAGLYGRRFKRLGVPPLSAAAGQVTAASLLLLPLALVIDRPWTLAMPPGSAVAAVLGLAALSTALAYVIFFRLLASAGATNLMLVTFLIPASALLLGALVLGEPVVARQLLGMALIGAGLVAIDGRVFAAWWPSRRSESA